ncbi:hypothetical protein M153_417000491 [Pseudoloma neurophilia]|uniref:Uncharacterized protein n=1 Tax=Pseudoloma neurophilia TaxID=146866 RepID=A0A0R0M4M0_9MICR|nr:hypothetical protein M153_417000491 [Pseudoloma neurophilia]
MFQPGDLVPNGTTYPENIVRDGKFTVSAKQFRSHILPITNLYHPQVNDVILVKAVYITGDFIKCIIISSDNDKKTKHSLYCHLLSLSFYNVTKRNKPKIETNELLLVRIVKITNSFILVSAKEEWLGQTNKLIEKYELELTENESSKEGKHKLLMFLSPIAVMNIFMTGLEIQNTFACVGMNGAVLLWGKKVQQAKEKLLKEYVQ